MLRLQDFITIIRNTKTIAEERAEYQKEMAAIRESFAKHEESLRPRNVTKLLFINMSGQETNFGQMECLNLITASSMIEKRIGYLGLTQLFHEKSELLMMSTNRLRVDLSSSNNSIVGLVLCVVSEICTTQLARELHNQVLKCISNNSFYIRKKAILTGIRIIKKCPQYISEFLMKINSCLDEKNHGVLLSCMAFLENVILLDESHINELVALVPKLGRVYKMIAQEHNPEYDIGGVQDPFLLVSILKILRIFRRYSQSFDKYLVDILVISHDSICSKISNNLKNGSNAVLLECFQCFMVLEPTPLIRQMVSNVLTKFISVRDANTKYLSLFNLNLLSKYDLSIVKSHKGTIFECLNQNDNLIKNFALDLIYLIAEADNTPGIVKELLNTLLSATDEDFIPDLALKICLIVEKHSQSRRWHFDTILKVLILADQSVKEESAKSLVHLITSTPKLQDYCMAKLFFSTSENLQNDALAKVAIYLIGQIGEILIRNKSLQISQSNILDLIESVIFRIGTAGDTIAYALSSLLKLFEKFPSEKSRISKMIKSFETHSELEVQKRACEYAKLIQSSWDLDRKAEICIPVPPFRETAEAFRSIPIGQTSMDFDVSSVKMPTKMEVNYEEQMKREDDGNKNQREIVISKGKQDLTTTSITSNQQSIFDDIMNGGDSQPPPSNAFSKKKQQQPDLSDDIFSSVSNSDNQNQQANSNVVSNDDPFNILNLNMGGNNSVQIPPQGNDMGMMGDLMLGGSSNNQMNNQNAGGDLLGGLDFLGINTTAPNQNQMQAQNQNQSQGFNWNSQPVQQQQAPKQDDHQILAYENSQIQIWMICNKQNHNTAKVNASYVNKTQSSIEGLSIQAAVMKYLKLTINPLNNTTMQPLSKGAVHQTMTIVNNSVGQKGIVMKMKIGYTMNGQKLNFEEKISNFPQNM